MNIRANEKLTNSKLIGGVFAFEEPSEIENSNPPFLDDKALCFSNARSAIKFITDYLQPEKVWIPSYLCKSVLQALDTRYLKIRFYAIDTNLSINRTLWLQDLARGDIVIFIDYFGFRPNEDLIKAAKDKGAYVVKDASQALLSDQSSTCADFIVYSPRKFLGVPDGGILSIQCDIHFENIPLKPPPGKWWLKSLRANLKRREFDNHGGDKQWFELFQAAEEEAPVGDFLMSDLTFNILKTSLDYEAIKQRRISNYLALLEKLRPLAIFPDLKEGTVPLGFPVRLKDRDGCRIRLFSHNIFPPIHWPIKGLVPSNFKASYILVDQIMTLPCDQRYNEDDMLRIARLLQNDLPP